MPGWQNLQRVRGTGAHGAAAADARPRTPRAGRPRGGRGAGDDSALDDPYRARAERGQDAAAGRPMRHLRFPRLHLQPDVLAADRRPLQRGAAIEEGCRVHTGRHSSPVEARESGAVGGRGSHAEPHGAGLVRVLLSRHGHEGAARCGALPRWSARRERVRKGAARTRRRKTRSPQRFASTLPEMATLRECPGDVRHSANRSL
jgi:hypothetical protein